MCCVIERTEKERLGELRVGSVRGGEDEDTGAPCGRDLARHISQAEGRHEQLV